MTHLVGYMHSDKDSVDISEKRYTLSGKDRLISQILLVSLTTQITNALAILVAKADEEQTDFQLHTEPDFLHSLYVVATKIKNDVKMFMGHKRYDNLTNTAAQQCILDSLYLLVKWMLIDDVNPLDIWENDSPEKTDEKQLQAIFKFVTRHCL